MINKNIMAPSISAKEAQELFELIGRLDNDQKKDALNVIRGFALAAECENERGET